MTFPLLLHKGDTVTIDFLDMTLTFRAEYQHVFPDLKALGQFASDAASLRYEGLTVIYPPDYAKSVAEAQKLLTQRRQESFQRARLARRLERARQRQLRLPDSKPHQGVSRMIQLGETVTDSITGFTGIAVSRTEYLYGCVRVAVEPTELRDGKPVESQFFDEQRLTAASPAKAGGSGAVPPPRRIPPAHG